LIFSSGYRSIRGPLDTTIVLLSEDGLMSLFSRPFGKRPRTEPEKPHDWKTRELGIYFEARPADPVWKAITAANADIIQGGLLEIWQRANLESDTDTNALPKDVIDLICEVANTIGGKSNLNPAFIILITHQYVDTDRIMRQTYRSRWVAFMVTRSRFAPPPELYMDYIKAQYFGDQ
jgi:hypothetical protein